MFPGRACACSTVQMLLKAMPPRTKTGILWDCFGSVAHWRFKGHVKAPHDACRQTAATPKVPPRIRRTFGASAVPEPPRPVIKPIARLCMRAQQSVHGTTPIICENYKLHSSTNCHSVGFPTHHHVSPSDDAALPANGPGGHGPSRLPPGDLPSPVPHRARPSRRAGREFVYLMLAIRFPRLGLA